MGHCVPKRASQTRPTLGTALGWGELGMETRAEKFFKIIDQLGDVCYKRFSLFHTAIPFWF